VALKEHATRAKLIDAAVVLMNEEGSRGFTAEDVLKLSGVSNGSLYHHFKDFRDLVTTAQIRRASRAALGVSEVIPRLIVMSETADEFFARIEELYRYVFDPNRKDYRVARIVGFGAALEDEELGAILVDDQAMASNLFIDLFQQAVVKGFLSPHLRPETLVAWTQAIALGAVSNDLAADPVGADALAKMTVDAIRGLSQKADAEA
jgi:AcrR family transcriptional regulator